MHEPSSTEVIGEVLGSRDRYWVGPADDLHEEVSEPQVLKSDSRKRLTLDSQPVTKRSVPVEAAGNPSADLHIDGTWLVTPSR
jgi:hypothetical protein